MCKKLMYIVVASCLMLFLVETSFGGVVHLRRHDGGAARHLSMARKRLRTQFGFPLPTSARAECTGKSDDGRVLFFCVRMPARDAARFKSKLIENGFKGGETLIHIENNKRVGEHELRVLSYLVMFSRESTGLAYFYFYP